MYDNLKNKRKRELKKNNVHTYTFVHVFKDLTHNK